MTRSSLLPPLVLLVVRKEGVWRSRFERSAEKVARGEGEVGGRVASLEEAVYSLLRVPRRAGAAKEGERTGIHADRPNRCGVQANRARA